MVAPGPPGNSRRQNRAAPERVGLKAGPGKWQRILYIAGKYQPERRWRDIEDIDWADVLSIYLTDIGEPNDQFEIEARIDRLNEFWGGKMLSEVNAWACAGYVKRLMKSGFGNPVFAKIVRYSAGVLQLLPLPVRIGCGKGRRE